MKVVLDTNVILAGFGTRGLCETVVALCLDQHEPFLSESILSEAREHLAGKFKMPPARVQEVVRFLREHAEIVTPNDVSPTACRDPDDLAVLGTALAAQAHCLITGDKDLLSMESFQDIAILSPRDFYEKYKTG